MMTAYLLAMFRLDGDVPVFMGTGIFSESNPTTVGNQVMFIVDSADGKTYGEAKRILLENVKAQPWQQWALRSLVQR